MTRLGRLQLLGPVASFLAVVAAESAACALAAVPTSETLWYVNLTLFGIFQKSHYVVSDFIAVPASQLLFIALPIFALACYGSARNRTLPLAIASNLSFVYASFLAFSWYRIERLPLLQASLAPIAIPSGATLFTLSVLLGCSLLSFLVSHLLYLCRICAKAQA